MGVTDHPWCIVVKPHAMGHVFAQKMFKLLAMRSAKSVRTEAFLA